jgi:flagellar basal body-associated protein FliL
MDDDIGGWLWVFIDIALVVILGGTLVYGTVMWRKWRQHPRQAEERDRATREAYERPDSS